MRSLDVETERKLTEYANATGRAVGGAWSIDILETKRGWHVTDMAEAAKLVARRAGRMGDLPAGGTGHSQLS